MTPQSQPRRPRNSSKVNLLISFIFHGAIVLTLVYFAARGIILGPDSFNPHIELMGDQAAQLHHSAEEMRQTANRLPLLEGLDFILAPFLYGLGFAAPAFVYKALKDETGPSAP